MIARSTETSSDWRRVPVFSSTARSCFGHEEVDVVNARLAQFGLSLQDFEID